MNYLSRNTITLGLSVAAIYLLAACDTAPSLRDLDANDTTHQAIDGYIVNAKVFCDGLRNGQTLAAGRFSCPANTTITTVRGGSDVGTDKITLTGGTPFVGELQGPASTRYITPLTTIATKMATSNGAFSQNTYEQAARSVTESLGIPELDLSLNPIDNLELLKANAQVHQLIARFSATEDDYASVTTELADIFSSGTPVDLSNDTNTIVSRLNQRLSTSAPALALPGSVEATVSEELSGTNSKIEDSDTTGELENAITEAVEATAQAFSIDSTVPLISYQSYNRATEIYSLDELRDPAQHFGAHSVLLRDNWNETISISSSAFSIQQSLENTTVNVALEFVSANDNRKLSVTLSGVELSMQAGNTRSVAIKVPDGSIVNARGINENGVITDVSMLTANDNFVSSDDGIFSFRFYDIYDRLDSHYHILSQSGDYEMTVVISGVRFSVVDSSGSHEPAQQYTIRNGAESITGYGLRGYVSRRGRYD